MRIAVCDDDREDLMLIEKYIDTFDPCLQFDLFTSAENLLQVLQKTNFDIIFLDIEMQPLDGFTAAQQISTGNDKPLIIFTTKSSKYVFQGYEIAFRYLVKPIIFEDFSKVLNTAIKRTTSQRISVNMGGNNNVVFIRDIYYCEVFNHKTIIYTCQDKYATYTPLRNMQDMLMNNQFARPHGSYLVNLEHIVRFTQDEIVMRNGTKICMSRQKKEDFINKFNRFLGR